MKGEESCVRAHPTAAAQIWHRQFFTVVFGGIFENAFHRLFITVCCVCGKYFISQEKKSYVFTIVVSVYL
jgi:hypothetical protein